MLALGQGICAEGNQDLGIVVAEAAGAHVVEDADDLPGDVRAQLGDAGNELFNIDALLERVLAREEFVARISC